MVRIFRESWIAVGSPEIAMNDATERITSLRSRAPLIQGIAITRSDKTSGGSPIYTVVLDYQALDEGEAVAVDWASVELPASWGAS